MGRDPPYRVLLHTMMAFTGAVSVSLIFLLLLRHIAARCILPFHDDNRPLFFCQQTKHRCINPRYIPTILFPHLLGFESTKTWKVG
jgi:hypothetical protein